MMDIRLLNETLVKFGEVKVSSSQEIISSRKIAERWFMVLGIYRPFCNKKETISDCS